MYVLLLVPLLPLALLGTVLVLSWWEDLMLPTARPDESPAVNAHVYLHGKRPGPPNIQL
ncbi:hypothetical protein SSPIM334S_02695 [Streptomyces spiroverticillatus]